MAERMLATVQEVAEIKPIPNADAIEALRINGWWVVAKKDEFKVGDDVVFIEVDAWVPHHLAPFLSKGKEPRVYKGVSGERLRTVKLRGQLSQGLVLPLTAVPESALWFEDLTEVLGIQKWERELSPQLAGLAKGNFPSFIAKTDQERIQNLPEIIDELDVRYEVTTKLDGSSITIYVKDGEVGVCSRNLELKLDESNAGNTFVKTAMESRLLESLEWFHKETRQNIAIQGELMGPGIQGNREKLDEHRIYIFDVWDIDRQAYLGNDERQWVLESALSICERVRHVPRFHHDVTLRELGVTCIDDLLEMANQHKSLNHPIAEGFVFKEVYGNHSFKVISNRFLMKEVE
jgi:RNA ligase (TIGR02306 family)